MNLSDNHPVKNTNIYTGYRDPYQIISHAVWLYHKFTLSFRDIEELLSEKRLAITTYDKVRYQLKSALPHKIIKTPHRKILLIWLDGVPFYRRSIQGYFVQGLMLPTLWRNYF
jgi:hypothetical protein